MNLCEDQKENEDFNFSNGIYFLKIGNKTIEVKIGI